MIKLTRKVSSSRALVAFVGLVGLLALAFLWISSDSATATPVGGVASVSAGRSHTCAITTGGAVKCWGMNTWGQLGTGTNDDSDKAISVHGLHSGVTQISAGERHTCAVTDGGGVKCWGRNNYGQLGNNSLTDSNVPVDVVNLGSGVQAVSSGEFHTCALTTAGGVQCWGSTAAGS